MSSKRLWHTDHVFTYIYFRMLSILLCVCMCTYLCVCIFMFVLACMHVLLTCMQRPYIGQPWVLYLRRDLPCFWDRDLGRLLVSPRILHSVRIQIFYVAIELRSFYLCGKQALYQLTHPSPSFLIPWYFIYMCYLYLVEIFCGFPEGFLLIIH